MTSTKPLKSLKQKITLAFYIIVGMALFNGVVAILLSQQLKSEIEHLVGVDVVKVTTALQLAKNSEKLQIITARLNHYDNEQQRLRLLSELSAQWELLINDSRLLALIETSTVSKQELNHALDIQLYYLQQLPLLAELTDSALQANLQATNIQANLQATNIQANLTSMASGFTDEMQTQFHSINADSERQLKLKNFDKIAMNINTNQQLSQFSHLGEHLFTRLSQVKIIDNLVELNRTQREAMRLLLNMEAILEGVSGDTSLYFNLLSQIKQTMVGEDNLFELSRKAIKSTHIANAHLEYQADAAQIVATYTQNLVNQVENEIQQTGGELKSDSTAFIILIFCSGILYCLFIWLTSWHFITKGIIKPVMATRDAMNAIANEKLDTHMPVTDNLELQQMVNSLETLKSYAAQVKGMAETDGLTGCYNRRYLDIQLQKELEYARDHNMPLGIILFDIDNFKQFNDRYGHVAGDQCLKNIVNAAKSILKRPTDMLARYGGEEFMIVLPSSHLEEVYQFAERLREKIISLEIPHEDSPHAGILTISAGITCWQLPQQLDANSLINRADEALYHAKLTGRNRTEALLGQPIRYS
ncbi:diguanylate cyclase domain-containing protein [Shewanella baltica]|uniref:diguanylate cyclase domain-containing protein n=1 Tax=Shewanella baltica TaxID=62322 RepID=UPI003D78E9CD